MTVEKEEKLLKSLGLFTLLVFIPLNTFFVKNIFIKVAIIVPLLIAFIVLYFRKYKRDKRQNKDLTPYKMTLFFLGISLLMLVVALVYPSL
jgi:cytochrome c oxidase assembly factor CtaG